MRNLILTLLLAVAATALLPSGQAKAWADRWGRWHPDVVRPPLIVAPPPVYYPPRPYAHWVPPHWDYWGRWVPGYWA